jgi:hypothetical protein
MPVSLEADTCLLQVTSGHSQAEEPPGLAVFSAPRRAARGREKDALYLCLHLRGRNPLPANKYTELLDLATQTFFGSPGSVTSALRQAVVAVNQNLLAGNLGAASGGLPAQGGLVAAVLRGADLYAVLSGPGLVLVAHRQSVETFPTLSSRSLGLSQAPDVQYFHTLVQAEEYFCLCNSTPDGWNEKALTGLGGLTTLTLVLERLKETAKSDFAALVGRFEAARGAPLGLPLRSASGFRPITSLFRPRPATPADEIESLSTPLAELEPVATPAVPLEPTLSPASEPLPAVAEVQPEKPEAAAPAAVSSETAPWEEPAPVTLPPTASSTEPVAAVATALTEVPIATPPVPPATDWPALVQRAEKFEQADSLPSVPIIEDAAPAPESVDYLHRPPPRPVRGARERNTSWQRGLNAFARALAVTFSESAYNFRKLLARTLPEGMLQKDGVFAVPTSVQIAIAVIIPLLVVGLVAIQYIQRGQEQQFNEALEQAMLEKAAADMAPDPISMHTHWSLAQNWAEQARKLHPVDGRASALSQEAQAHLDQLDNVTRIDYRKLVANGLGPETRIKQLLLFGLEIFALDSGGNRIIHLAPDATGAYQVDTTFECSGGTVGKYTISTLVAMALLPQPNLMDTDAVVALDKGGGLLYCAPGQKPLSAYLTAPDMGWKTPTAVEVYSGRLYVLDSDANAIWQYATSGGDFTQPPAPYFAGASYNLGDVIDFTIATTSGEIFMLRQDGRLADCDRPSNSEAPTCVEVAKFSDTRPGRGPGERLWDVTQPLHLAFSPPPEPSLYLLDTGNAGLYQLSLKLELVRLFRPRQPLGGPITAMVTTADQVFVSAGDNVYAATRP